MKLSKLFFIFAFLLCNANLFAQNTDGETSQKIRDVVLRMTSEFVDYVDIIGDKSKGLETRKLYRDKALNLFLNKGNKLMLENETYNGSLIEIASIKSSPRPQRIPLKNYLNKLMQCSYYPKISIDKVSYAIPDMSSLKKLDDSTYVCTYEIRQFHERNDGNICTLIASKRINITLNKSDFSDDDLHAPRVFLCDVYAVVIP